MTVCYPNIKSCVECFSIRLEVIFKKMASLHVYGDYQPTNEDVQILREWTKKMPHIIQDYDDKFLAAVIKGRKGSLQKAKIVLEKLNCGGLRFPELFGHLDIFNPTTQKCLEGAIGFPLPKRLSNGECVIVISSDFKDTEAKNQHFTELWRYLLMTFYVLNWENQSCTKIVNIFDWNKTSPGHVKETTPVFVARVLESMKYVPIRLTAVYIVNLPPAIQWIFNMIKLAVKKKIADRIHFISSIETLYETVPREILPKDLGGDQDDMKTLHSRWMKKVESYRDRLVEENMKMRKLDPLRPKEEEIDEMVGTFKALNVD